MFLFFVTLKAMKHRTKSPFETQRIALFVIERFKKNFLKSGEAAVVALSGELGAGKTTFVQGLGKVLGVSGKIKSPTFVLAKKYKLKKYGIPWRALVHIDAYRLGGKKEPVGLWLKEIFNDAQNLVAIEWPEKIKKYIPNDAIWVELKHKGEKHRHIIITSPKR